jgi:hypothetical protein
MLFSSYKTQNLGFAFSKCVFYLSNGIPNGHYVLVCSGEGFEEI